MNFLLTAQKAVDLGIDPKAVNDSYAMSEIAREFDMGKNPTSKTNLLKTLQTVITAMLGEQYKATSHDVNFLMSVYSKKNRKALTVTCANPGISAIIWLRFATALSPARPMSWISKPRKTTKYLSEGI